MSGLTAKSTRFGPSTIVADALVLHPKARWVFAAYRIGGCSGCSNASRETLAEVARDYAIPLERLLRDLNDLPAAGPEN